MDKFKSFRPEKVKGRHVSKAEGLHMTAGVTGVDKASLKRTGLLSQKALNRIRWMESIVLKVDKKHGKPFSYVREKILQWFLGLKR